MLGRQTALRATAHAANLEARSTMGHTGGGYMGQFEPARKTHWRAPPAAPGTGIRLRAGGARQRSLISARSSAEGGRPAREAHRAPAVHLLRDDHRGRELGSAMSAWGRRTQAAPKSPAAWTP